MSKLNLNPQYAFLISNIYLISSCFISLSLRSVFFFFLFVFHFSLSILCISDASKKWQEKADLLTRLESQVKRMKENFDAKERLLLEERHKATEAHKYDTILH